MSFLRASVIAFLCLLTWSASAQPATTAFEEGLAKWKSGDCDGALPLFKQALTATGSPNARFYVARCLRDGGELAEAYEQMARTVKDARELAEAEERYAKTRDAAAGELAVLEAKVGRLIVVLDASVVDAYVTVDGATLPKERIGTLVAVAPGTIMIVAQSPDGVRTERRAAIGPGETKTVTITKARPTEPTPAVVPEPAEDTDPSWLTATRGLGFAVAAIGVAGVVVFIVQNQVADERFEALEDACGNAPCPDEPRFSDLISEGETAETVAAISLGVGIAGVLAGAAMIIFGGPDDAESTAEVASHPGGVGVRVRF